MERRSAAARRTAQLPDGLGVGLVLVASRVAPFRGEISLDPHTRLCGGEPRWGSGRCSFVVRLERTAECSMPQSRLSLVIRFGDEAGRRSSISPQIAVKSA